MAREDGEGRRRIRCGGRGAGGAAGLEGEKGDEGVGGGLEFERSAVRLAVADVAAPDENVVRGEQPDQRRVRKRCSARELAVN